MRKHSPAKSNAASRKRADPRRAEREQAAARQAARHSKARRDHTGEIAEDYVELIAQLMRAHGEARTVDIAEHLGVSHVTVTRTIQRLQSEGLVRSEPYRSIFLTDTGQKLAHEAGDRHGLVVRFLCKLGVDAATADADAEGIEHHLSAATLSAIRRFVDGA